MVESDHYALKLHREFRSLINLSKNLFPFILNSYILRCSILDREHYFPFSFHSIADSRACKYCVQSPRSLLRTFNLLLRLQSTVFTSKISFTLFFLMMLPGVSHYVAYRISYTAGVYIVHAIYLLVLQMHGNHRLWFSVLTSIFCINTFYRPETEIFLRHKDNYC